MSVALVDPALGEMLAAEILSPPRLLEDILEALASATFPIDPEINHSSSGGRTVIGFPLFESQLPILREILLTAGFSPDLLSAHKISANECAAYQPTL